MKNILHSDLIDATRLTRAGRLNEATAALQRMLRGAVAPADRSAQTGGSTVIDGEYETIETAGGSREPPKAGLWGPRPDYLRPLRKLGGISHGAMPSAPRDIPEGARFLTARFTNQAGSRPYKLYVPSGYRPGRPVPLIVMLHGCTQSADDFAAGTLMNQAAEERTCLVVYPEQTSSANMQKCWNWFSGSDQERDAGEPLLIAGITREVMRDYAVDSRCVYIAGLSAGGAAAAIMGDAYPDLYAAIGVHSGLACGAARDMPSALAAMRNGSGGSRSRTSRRIVPVIVFHGDRDVTVNSRNGDAVVAQTLRDTACKVSTEDGHSTGGHPFTRTRYADENGNIVVEQWLVSGAGHAWFGGSAAGSYTDPRGPDATGHMLRFFLEHPHPLTA